MAALVLSPGLACGGRTVKPAPFDYYRPATISEAVDLLAELREDAAILAGGMTLGPMLNLRMVRPRAVIDISRIAALKTISATSNPLPNPPPHSASEDARERAYAGEGREGAIVVTGAGVVQCDALDSDVVRRDIPLLAMALPWVGHFQTRNRGTLGGSVGHADPSAEIPLCLVVCGGTVVLQSKRRERRVGAGEFFLGSLTTARRPDEMIVALEWPRQPADAGCAFEEIAQRHGDFAIAAAACQLRVDRSDRVVALSLGLGGVESRPIAVDVRGFIGRPLRGLASALAEHVGGSVTPMEDHSAGAEFRTALAQTLVERVVETATVDATARREGMQ
jgi:2-furoyl-CoA dehydrogenase FAD binding subunit